MGDLEFGGYKHEITGGNDGGYNAPFDINGDGQEIDNWAKVTTQWKHKKGKTQLKAKKLQQLRYVSAQQGNAEVAGMFDEIAQGKHGANNGMLQKRAQHKPRAAPADPSMTPVRGLFDSEGNGDVSVKAKKLQQLRYVSAQQGNAEVAGMFDEIAAGRHGANNGMLQKRAQHKPAKAAPADPSMTPVRGLFDSEGNGDVSVKSKKLQQLAGTDILLV